MTSVVIFCDIRGIFVVIVVVTGFYIEIYGEIVGDICVGCMVIFIVMRTVTFKMSFK